MQVNLSQNRQDLEAECDRLLIEREKVFQEWAEAKVAYENLKDRNDDVLKAIMDELENVNGGNLAENKLTRMAKRTEAWKQHKSGVRLAYEKKLQADIKRDQVRKSYELHVVKYMKS